MNMNKKIESHDKINKILSTILLISWCLLIFYFSSQQGDISSTSSSRVLNFINKLFNINLYNYKYSILIVRKSAHMFLYFVLFLLSSNFFKKNNRNNYYKKGLLFCFIYAISDEIHQLFVIGRTFKLIDILIDMIGSTISYIFIHFLNKK